MGNKTSIPKPIHFEASPDGLAENMMSAPHDVVCELGGQRIHLGVDALSEDKRKHMLEEEINYQKKRVEALRKSQSNTHADPNSISGKESDIENRGDDEEAVSTTTPTPRSAPFVVLPDPDSGQAAYSVVQSSSDYLFVPSRTTHRRASIVPGNSNSADEYLEQDLQIKRAALESDICEIAGVQPFSLRVDKELQPALTSWDFNSIFNTLPSQPTPEEASHLSVSLMDDPEAVENEIVLFPKRAPVCHLSTIAAVVVIPIAAVIHEIEKQLERQQEIDQQTQFLIEKHIKELQSVEDEEQTNRPLIATEEDEAIVHASSFFKEGLSRLRLFNKLPAAIPGSRLTPESISKSSLLLNPSGTSPSVSPARTPRELHDQMIAQEKERVAQQQESLHIFLAPIQSDESRGRDEISAEVRSVLGEMSIEFQQQHSKLKSAEDLLAKQEVDELIDKVNTSLVTSSPSAPSVPPQDTEDVVEPTDTPTALPKAVTSSESNKTKHTRKNVLAKKLNTWKQQYKVCTSFMRTRGVHFILSLLISQK